MSVEQLDTGISKEKQKLKDAAGPGFSGEVLGRGVMYEVGADFNLLVPNEWLEARCEELDIPEYLVPSPVAPHWAYDRAIKMMKEDWLDEFTIEAPRMDNDIPEEHVVTVDLKEGDGKRIWHVRAEVFFDEDESKQEGGTWVQHDLGHFTYDEQNQMIRARKDDGLGEEHLLRPIWDEVASAGEALHRKMQNYHVAGDIRSMIHDSTKTNSVIKLKRSVYLYPVGMLDFVEKMATLFADIDEEFKEVGEPVAIRTFEVLDDDDKQEWIQHRVKKTLEENADKVLSAAFEQLDEGEAADEVVKSIKQNLGDSAETAETYNALLEAEVQVETVLREQKESIDDEDREEIIDKVISQTDIDDF